MNSDYGTRDCTRWIPRIRSDEPCHPVETTETFVADTETGMLAADRSNRETQEEPPEGRKKGLAAETEAAVAMRAIASPGVASGGTRGGAGSTPSRP